MSNPLQQTIEALAKEKGIEPDVVISAIEEAVATASRKYYKTGENLKTRFNTETGQVDLFALKTVVQDVANPATEIAIDDARQMYRQLYGEEVANSLQSLRNQFSTLQSDVDDKMKAAANDACIPTRGPRRFSRRVALGTDSDCHVIARRWPT